MFDRISYTPVSPLGETASQPAPRSPRADFPPFSRVLEQTMEPVPAAKLTTEPEVASAGWVSALAHRDSAAAKQLLETYTFELGDPPVSILDPPDPLTGATARYVGTGELVTPEREQWFREQAVELRDQRIALHNREMAQGAPPADILDKILHFMDAQDPYFLQLINWQVISGRTPGDRLNT